MATVKPKFRPSTVDGKEGTLFYRIIHNRRSHRIRTGYKLFPSEWDERSEAFSSRRAPMKGVKTTSPCCKTASPGIPTG